MDPDETLRTALAAASAALHALDMGAKVPDATVDDLAASLVALDAWLRMGGALPARWARA